MRTKRALVATTVFLPNLVIATSTDCELNSGLDIGTGGGYSAAFWVTPTWWGETQAQYFGAQINYNAANVGRWTSCDTGEWYTYDYGEGNNTAVYRTCQWPQYDIGWSRINNCSGTVM